MNVHVITTLHKDGYELFGKLNIDTWSNYFPSDWSITYYAENHRPTFSNRIEIVDFTQRCPKWLDFYNEVKKRSEELEGKELNRYKKALRWSFKMFVLLDALENKTNKFILWLDSDIRAVSKMPEDWLNKLNQRCIACKLEKLKVGNHIETGAVLVNNHHKDSEKISAWIKQGYEQFKILDTSKPWDGIWMASLLVDGNVAWNNVELLGKNNVKNHWLIHDVGKSKFKNVSINERSGRKVESELI